ncbi:PilW family protein [Photobacterium lipolyticum]|uniref:MSHA biogenesis protein MshO n=1 Tax=Photobacterium lipolyticum TaxID=266810 RepID=A0A2T3MX82_9GAMM|nr:type II secretion system protein [Photobacterium lipolyticum]PSW04555.1 MSHA biogenesis protein MshO [Photobacterium lipolyticum]
MPVSKYSQGFTLIEIIMSLIVLSVISVGIGSYLQLGAQGYIQNRDREQLQSLARFAAERISRELRHAVPNSLSVSDDNKCITFTPIEYAGFYTNQTLEEIETLEGVMSGSVEGKDAKVTNRRLVINPVRMADLTSASRSAAIKEVAGIQPWTISFNNKTTFASESASGRFYIYGIDARFCISGNRLTRATRKVGNTAFSTAVPLAEQIVSSESEFNLDHASLNRNALVHFQLAFSQNGEKTQYSHDVQVINVP